MEREIRRLETALKKAHADSKRWYTRLTRAWTYYRKCKDRIARLSDQLRDARSAKRRAVRARAAQEGESIR